MPHSLVPVLTPHGALHLENLDADFVLDAAVADRLAGPFDRDGGHGLLQLGVGEAGSHVPPALAFWRSFAMRFVARLCAQDETAAAGKRQKIAALPSDELAALIEEAPPMQGGEYLRVEVLATLWQSMERALGIELAESGLPLQDFLKDRDARWRLVGRVHFNLAENRRDADCPFAFMATYTSALAAHGTLRHLPLGKALGEYAGSKQKLLRLLEPLQQAGESSGWLKAIVESGEIFQPLRWTVRDAM